MSRLTVPVALVHGAVQVRMKLDVPVIGDTASLRVAEIEAVLTSTPTAPLAGVSAVTEGSAAAIVALPKI